MDDQLFPTYRPPHSCSPPCRRWAGSRGSIPHRTRAEGLRPALPSCPAHQPRSTQTLAATPTTYKVGGETTGREAHGCEASWGFPAACCFLLRVSCARPPPDARVACTAWRGMAWHRATLLQTVTFPKLLGGSGGGGGSGGAGGSGGMAWHGTAWHGIAQRGHSTDLQYSRVLGCLGRHQVGIGQYCQSHHLRYTAVQYGCVSTAHSTVPLTGQSYLAIR